MMKPLLLRNLDLNLLYAFSILMEELNVSRAAERLYIGQPGLSTALKRLREALDDQLFVRVGRKLQPTPRAQAIAPEIARALAAIERSIQPLNAFDPKSWAGEFRVGLCDNLEMAFFGALTASLREKAPHARVVAVAATKRDSVTLLDEGAYDFSVAVHNDPASWHVRVPLFDQHLMCVYDSRKVQLSSPISTEDYLNAQHVTVSSQGSDTQELDNFLQKAGIRREVAASVSRYAAVGPVLQAIGAIATVPETVAFCMARIYGLKTSPTPIQLPSEPISMLYRKVDDVSGSSAWFRQQFMEVTAYTLSGLDPDAKCVHRGSGSHVRKDERI